MEDCIFCKIKEGKIPAEFVYKDEDVMVFPDIEPFRKIHMLVVPAMHVKEFIELEDPAILEKISEQIKKVIRKEGLDTRGYRITTNGGGAQAVDHLHFHVMGPFEKAAKL